MIVYLFLIFKAHCNHKNQIQKEFVKTPISNTVSYTKYYNIINILKTICIYSYQICINTYESLLKMR